MGTKIKDAQLLESVTGAERIPVSDGSGNPKAVTTEALKNFVGAGSSGGGGIPIVDSEDKLETLDLPQGGLASVAYDIVKKASFRDLYQPTMNDLDQNTGLLVNPDALSKVDKLEFTFSEGIQSGESVAIYLIPKTIGLNNRKMLMIGIETNNGVVISILGMAAISDYSQYTFCQYDDNGVPSINQENIDAFNELLTIDDWCYFSSPDEGFVITEAQFDTLDKFMKPVASVVGTNLYQKEPKQWIKFPREDLFPQIMSIQTNVKTLTPKVSTLESDVKRLTTRVTTLEGEDNYPYNSMSNMYSDIISSNTYYKRTPSTKGMTISFTTPSNTKIVNEYVLEVVCNGASVTLPADLIWVNGVSPTFDEGTTVVISVVNKLAMFAVFETV
jgi:hypothetical protein